MLTAAREREGQEEEEEEYDDGGDDVELDDEKGKREMEK